MFWKEKWGRWHGICRFLICWRLLFACTENVTNRIWWNISNLTGDVWKPKSRILSIVLQCINSKTLIEIVIVMCEKRSYGMSLFSNRNKFFHIDSMNKLQNINYQDIKKMQKWQRFFLLHVWWVRLPREQKDNWRVLQKACYTYLKIKLGDQDKTWGAHIIYKSCKESLRLWTTGKKQLLNSEFPWSDVNQPIISMIAISEWRN